VIVGYGIICDGYMALKAYVNSMSEFVVARKTKRMQMNILASIERSNMKIEAIKYKSIS
jgi:hypothetical protein